MPASSATAYIKKAKHGVPVGYDGVIIGSAIRVGKLGKARIEYVRNNRDTLQALPSAFFSVSLGAHGDETEAERYIAKFEQQTDWHPATVASIRVALLYTKVRIHQAPLDEEDRLRRIMPSDMSRDYVYTEWDWAERFTEDFLAQLVSAQAEPA